MHTEIACKEQLTIRLWHMSGRLNSCRCQPKLRFAEAEGKFITECWQYKEDQFRAMKDQIEDLTIQLSNLCRHNENGFRNLITEHQTQGCQHLAQTYANQRVSRFELKIPKFQGDPQPKEFLDLVLAVEEVFEFNRVSDEQRVFWWYTHSEEELLCGGNS
jgi:hypothetical protein